MNKFLSNRIIISSGSLIIFITTVACFCWVEYSVTDKTLINRLLGFSLLQLVLLIITISNKTIINKVKSIPRDILIAIIGLFVFQLISISYALNYIKVLYELQNTIILALTIITIQIFDTNKHIKTVKNILNTIAFIYVLFAFTQLLQLDSYDKQSLYNITSLAGHKNLFSSFGVLLIICISVTQIIQTSKSFLPMLVIILLTLMVGIVQTRSALIGIILGSSLVGYLLLIHNKKNINIKYITTFIIIIFSCLITFTVNTSIFNDNLNSESSIERILIWNKTLSIIYENPILGIGSGNWSLILPSFGLLEIDRVINGNIIFQKAHNEYLQAYSEIGLAGVVCYIYIFVTVFFMAFKVFKNQKNIYSSIVIIGLISYTVIMFFDFPNSRPSHLVILGIFVGILSIWYKKNNYKSKLIKINKFFVWSCLLVVLGSLTVSFFRFNGEINMKKLLKERSINNQNKIIKIGEKTSNIFYDMDRTGIPIDWYTGIANYKIGNLDKAQKDFKNAYKINPYNHHILNNYAISVSNNDLNKAQFILEKALKINPFFEEARSNLIKVLIESGNIELAKTHLDLINNIETKQVLVILLQKYLKDLS